LIEGSADGLIEVNINDIDPNVKQPRKNFDEDKLKSLAESIDKYGIVQPIIVKQINNRYKIVAGERRWRAARLAGIKKVPVIVKEVSDINVMEIALIENLQRQDLNPIEEAEAYDKLIKEHNLTQEKLSLIVGKSRSAITNCIRLNNLNDKIKECLINGEISEGHARAAMGVTNEKKQLELIDKIIQEDLSVREVERIVKKINATKSKQSSEAEYSAEYNKIQEKLQNVLGTKVKLTHKNNRGKILIEYYSVDELEGILDKLGIESSE